MAQGFYKEEYEQKEAGELKVREPKGHGLTGPQKAAVVLVAMGSDASSQIFQNLDEHEIAVPGPLEVVVDQLPFLGDDPQMPAGREPLHEKGAVRSAERAHPVDCEPRPVDPARRTADHVLRHHAQAGPDVAVFVKD